MVADVARLPRRLHTLWGYGTYGVMSTTTVTVTGMSCGHCATSVREEITEIPGVRAVDVDLVSGNVTIDSDSAVETAAIRTAVEDAGYQLAG
jgi:copper chaperone